MSIKQKRKPSAIAYEVIISRMKQMKNLRKYYEERVDECHVKLQKGNSKTGQNVFTVSLIPILDCTNCKECSRMCYDIRNVCWLSKVQHTRARNSAIHHLDIERYWNEINMQIKLNSVYALRLNVGGDIVEEDLPLLNKVAKENPKCNILFFTKNYEGVNNFLDKEEFNENVKCIFSAWINTEMNNRHYLPVAHVLFPDGTTTAPDFSYFCKGNCSECLYNEKGCWTLKQDEHIAFLAH